MPAALAARAGEPEAEVSDGGSAHARSLARDGRAMSPAPISEHAFGSGGLVARHYALANGLGVILVDDRSAPICAYHTWFRVGSRDEREGRTGIAHLFEHLMFNETEHLAPGEFDRRLEAVGADTNAATWLDWTYYREVVPSAQLELVMELEAERMAHLVVHEPQLESERSVVANERRQRVEDDVDGFLQEELWRRAFTAHPYRWPTIGWMEDIQAIELEDARTFYKMYYAPNNATVVIVGDLEAALPSQRGSGEERTLGALERHYGHLAPSVLPPRATSIEPPQTAERRAAFARPVLADRALIGWRGVALDDPDHAALEVVAELLANGQSSLLHRELVVERELCSSVSADVGGFRDPGLFELRLGMQRGHRAAVAEGIVYDRLAQLAREPVAQAQLDKARNRIEARLWHDLRPHEGKAEALGHHETTVGDYRLLFDAARRVRAVGAEDLQRVVGRHLDEARRTVVVAEPARTHAARRRA
jgi:zinc protease